MRLIYAYVLPSTSASNAIQVVSLSHLEGIWEGISKNFMFPSYIYVISILSLSYILN